VENELISTQSNALTNPEAIVDALRRSYVHGDVTRLDAAMSAAGLAMVAFGLQRQSAIDDAEAFCKSLSLTTSSEANVDEQIVIDWCTHNTTAVAATARAMRAMLVCEFDRLGGLAAEVEKHSAAGNAAWAQMVENEPNIREEETLALWVGVLQRLPLLARMFDVQGQAQRHLLLGDRQQYLEGLQRVQTIVEDSRNIVVSAHDPYAPMFRQLLSQTEQNVRAQLNFVARSLQPSELSRLRPNGNKVFIIHGHDDAAWRDLKTMLEDEFKLDTLVLKQEASGTRTLIEKFEVEAAQCAFAIALVTPDDLVKNNATGQAKRTV
jgi:hypothetical protein